MIEPQLLTGICHVGIENRSWEHCLWGRRCHFYWLGMSLWASPTSLLCRIKTLFGVLRFFVVKKHCALHLHPQDSLTLRGGVHWKMCALGREAKAKIEICYFCPSSHIPRDTRWGSGQQPFLVCALCCPEVTAMTFHSSCTHNCDGSRI